MIKPKTPLEINQARNKKLIEYKLKINNAINLIQYFINCEEFNRDSIYYQGFLNISVDSIENNKQQWVSDFVYIYNETNFSSLIDEILGKLKLYLEEKPSEDEIIIGCAI